MKLRRWWKSHGSKVLKIAIVILAGFAILKLGSEFWRLVMGETWLGAIDLKIRHHEVTRWFAGKPIYHIPSAVYPPASYVFFWPLLGWLSIPLARWFCLVTTLATLGWLCSLIVRESGAENRLERVFVVLMLLSMNPLGVSIGNGQITLYVLTLLTAGLMLIARDRHSLSRDLLAAFLIMVSLTKPNVSVPFFWLVLIVPGRLRPAIFVGVGYLASTFLGTTFQGDGLFALLQDWLDRTEVCGSVGDSTDVISMINVSGATMAWQRGNITSGLILVGLGIWISAHRKVDFWILLGVTAVIARIWTYHKLYDNVLILLPMVALFQAAKGVSSSERGSFLAGILLALNVMAMLIPSSCYNFWLHPWPTVFIYTCFFVWTLDLIYLLSIAWRARWRGGRARVGSDPA